MNTGQTLWRRMFHLTDKFDLLIGSKSYQVLSAYGKQMRRLLREEEVELFMELFRKHVNEGIKEKLVYVDLSGDNSFDRLLTKIYKDPEMFLLYKEFRTLLIIIGVMYSEWSIDRAQKLYKDGLYMEKDENINVEN